MTYFSKGAIHIHTTFSDGTGSIEDITKAAKEAGLDWIIITDHNKIGVKEGIYNDVYVLAGEEISPRSNHCIAFDIENEINSSDSTQEFLSEIKKQNGFSCICYPQNSLDKQNTYSPIMRDYNDFRLIDGVEIWNYFSNWTNDFDDSTLFSQLKYYLFGNFLKNEPIKEILEMWDKMNYGVRIPKFAIGGINAHAKKYKKYMFNFTVYPYLTMFKTLINVIALKERLPNNFEKAKKIILNSIKSSNNFILDQRRGKNCEIYFFAHNKELSCTLGDNIEIDDDSEITVILPHKAEIRLIKDGEVWLTSKNKKRADFKVKYPGTYRIEIYRRFGAWVFTNPVIFTNKGGRKWISGNM